MIDWDKSTWTKADYKAVKRIIDRAQNEGMNVDRMSTMMDLDACNMVCPIDLAKLEGFDTANLMHDLTGIARHLNRETGELGGCFVPRCAKVE